MRFCQSFSQGQRDLVYAAEASFSRALALMERDDHSYALCAMGGLGQVYERQGRYNEANEVLTKALAIGRRVLGQKHPQTHGLMNSLARTLDSQGRHAEAEPLLIESYESSCDDSGLRLLSLEQLVRHFDSWNSAEPGKGFAEKAAQWRAKLEAVQPPKSESAETPN